jgi:epoxide hydrolase
LAGGRDLDDWSQGVPLAHVRELCAYWADGCDWRATEARLNALPQFRTELDGLGVDGLDIHFLHVRSRHPGALPLVLTHGWPGSVVEFLDVISRR